MTREEHLAMIRHQLGHGVDFLAAALSALTVSYHSWPSIRWRFWVAQGNFANAHAWLALADEEAVVQRLETALDEALERAEKAEQRCERLRRGLVAVELKLETLTGIVDAALDPNNKQPFDELGALVEHVGEW